MNFETILNGFFANFGFIAEVVGILVAVVRAARGKPFFEELFRWSVFFGVGVNCFYSGLGHLFLPEYSANLIGWEDSPFQLEVGSADLAIGVAGLLSFWGNYGFRLAIAIIAAIFYGIDAVGHFRQMALENNYATGNAGSWLWIDVSMPIILMITAAVCGLRRSTTEQH
ncbi:MAG: DUF6790 family protein [Planctomycetota bacterium]